MPQKTYATMFDPPKFFKKNISFVYKRVLYLLYQKLTFLGKYLFFISIAWFTKANTPL